MPGNMLELELTKNVIKDIKSDEGCERKLLFPNKKRAPSSTADEWNTPF